MHNIISGCSVILPISACDTCDSPMQEGSGPLQSKLPGHDVCATGSILYDRCCVGDESLSWTWPHCIAGEAGGTTPPEDEQISTLLDQAKGADFQRLCGELVWFFSTVKRQPQVEYNGKVAHAEQHVHSRSCCAQCTFPDDASLACQISEARYICETFF